MGRQYDYFEISEGHQVALLIFQGFDTGVSRMSMMNLAGGIGFGSGDSKRLRRRAGCWRKMLQEDMLARCDDFGLQ